MNIIASKVDDGWLLLLVSMGGSRLVAMKTLMESFEIRFPTSRPILGGEPPIIEERIDGEVRLRLFALETAKIPEEWREPCRIQAPPLRIAGPADVG
jgi:hypothetical protein